MTRDEAKQALLDGKTIRHSNYGDDEFIYMDMGGIRDENGYHMGGFLDEFWTRYQVWKDGWEITEKVKTIKK